MLHSLPTAVLGRTGLKVTRLGYGTASDKPDEGSWQRILPAVLDLGINFIDTSNDYGTSWGMAAEDMIGKYISHRRSEYYIATKCGCAPPGSHIWNRENTLRGLHESLQRLNTDYIDVMQYHNPTVDDVEGEDLVAVLEEMKTQGKVRWLGMSTTLPHITTYIDWGVFDVLQLPSSALEREHEDWITKAADVGIGIVIRGGVAQGEPDWNSSERRESKWQKFEEAGLDDLRESGESRTTFILRYTLSHPHSHTNIVGTLNPDHLIANADGVMNGPLSPDTYSEAKSRLDSVGMTATST